MNGQKPEMREWPEIIEDLKIAIHNGEISLKLLKVQLKEARENLPYDKKE